jgi:nitrogen regulatory protein PII
MGGIWGAVATGIFATRLVNPAASGLLDGNWIQVPVQLVAVAATAVYSFAASWLLARALKATVGLRVREEEESVDSISQQHGEKCLRRCIAMKKIEAILRPEKLDAVKLALEKIGIHAMTVTEVRAGKTKRHYPSMACREYRVDFLPKVKLEVVLSEEDSHSAVDAICRPPEQDGKETE